MTDPPSDTPTPVDPSRPEAPRDLSRVKAPARPRRLGRAQAGLRDPGSPPAALLAWLVILCVVGFIVVGHNFPELLGAEAAEDPAAAIVEGAEPTISGPSLQMTFAGRYAVGAGGLAPGAGVELIKQLDQVSRGDAVESLRTAIVVAELDSAEAAIERLRDLDLSNVNDATAQIIDADRDALIAVYESGSASALSPDQEGGLLERHNWFARLALGFGQTDSNPHRAQALAQAQKLVLVVFVGFFVGGFALLVGFVLSILAIMKIGARKVRWSYARPVAGGSVYLEAFAIFLVGFIVIQILAEWVHVQSDIDTSRVLIWLLALCPLWPLLRGADPRAWRYAIGWHKGKGVLREIGAGFFGYLAGLPVLLLGVGTMLLMMLVAGFFLPEGQDVETPTHPLGDEMMAGGWLGLVGLFALATIWAPFVEETMFRGCLYHHFRGRIGALASAVAVAFVFAAIHPQGWLGVPPLMALAIVFATIREWRGSIIAPAVAHAINNGFIFSLLYFALA